MRYPGSRIQSLRLTGSRIQSNRRTISPVRNVIAIRVHVQGVGRTSVLALGIVVLVVLAGCNSFGAGEPDREPFDVDQHQTSTDPAGDAAPVIAFDPVENTVPDAWALLDAHETTLEGTSYTVHLTHVERGPNDSIVAAQNWTTSYGSNQTTVRQTRSMQTPNRSLTLHLYSNGTHVWERRITNDPTENTTRLLQDANGDPVPLDAAVLEPSRSILERGLQSMNVTAVESLDTVPSSVDEPVFEITAREVNLAGIPGSDKRSLLTLYVTESGQLIEYYHRYSYVQDGERNHGETRIEFRYRGVGTIDPPGWVPATTNDSSTLYQRPMPASNQVPSLNRPRPDLALLGDRDHLSVRPSDRNPNDRLTSTQSSPGVGSWNTRPREVPR